jgi:hypothetical protein
MSGRFSSLKSLADFYAPLAKIAQYDDHVASEFEPCTCNVCLKHMLRFGAAYVVKANGEWRLKIVTDDDSDEERIKAISGKAVYASFSARGSEEEFFAYVINVGLRAFPHDVSKVKDVLFSDKKRKAREDISTPAKAANTAMAARDLMPADDVAAASARAVASAVGINRDNLEEDLSSDEENED